MEIEIEIEPNGPVADAPDELQWVVREATGECEMAYVAGQPVSAMRVGDEPPRYELQYLGLVGRGFESMAQAKMSAPAFAEHVLGYLAQIASNTEAIADSD